MPKLADLLGIVGSTFTIGSKSLSAGLRRLAFRSGSFLGTIDWTPTANQTINLPNASGTVLLDTTATIAGAIVNPQGVSVVDFTIPAGVRRLTLLASGLIVQNGTIARLGTSEGVLTTGYNSLINYIGNNTGSLTTNIGIAVPECSIASTASFCMTFYRVSPNQWNSTGQSRDIAEYSQICVGNILLPGELTTFRYISASTISSGSLQLLWEF